MLKLSQTLLEKIGKSKVGPAVSFTFFTGKRPQWANSIFVLLLQVEILTKTMSESYALSNKCLSLHRRLELSYKNLFFAQPEL